MIGIVFVGELKFNPYLKTYTDILEKNEKEYEVLYWSRESLPPLKDNHFSFNKESKQVANKVEKLKGFYGFRKWLVQKLKQKNYDKLIILSTLSGIIIADFLTKYYPKKYIFDIRDYSYENSRIFKKIQSNVIDKSYSTFISSRGFESFLPKNQTYQVVHNFNEETAVPLRFEKNHSIPLNIVWVGGVRYFEHQKNIINALSNDPRFEMNYYGFGPEIPIYKEYVEKIAAKNVKFLGEYKNADKKDILATADILNNSYVNINKEMETRYALSNKVYDGIFLAIPQLVESDTYKGNLIEKEQIGISLNPQAEDYADKLYNYYQNIDEQKFTNNIHKLSKIVLKENNKIRLIIKDFIV